jgi:hypothetical protein
MRSTSCGYETPDGMEFPQHLPSVSTLSSLVVCLQAAGNSSPRPLAAKLSTFPNGLEGQRTRLSVHPGVMEKRE